MSDFLDSVCARIGDDLLNSKAKVGAMAFGGKTINYSGRQLHVLSLFSVGMSEKSTISALAMYRTGDASLDAFCGFVLPAITVILQAGSTCPSRGFLGSCFLHKI